MHREHGHSAHLSHSGAVRMTEGSIPKLMLQFALPLLLGNLFQQLYNTADSIIVGNFLGSSALAAVSSTWSVIHLMISFFQGLFIGAGVVVARFFGAGDEKMTGKSIHTTAGLGLICGGIMTLVGVSFTPVLLRWMGTPPEIMGDSVLYFRVYFAGSMAFVMYNCLVGILQSVGDSRHPLIYLVTASVMNVILDLVLIGGLGMGVGAAAAATVISQAFSSIMCFRRLLRSPEEYRLYPSRIHLDPEIVKMVLLNGVPSGLQNSIIAIANVVVQTNINAFGSLVMAGCGAYSKIEGFTFLPITCFSMALTTFIGQNLGAGKRDRVIRGAIFGAVSCVAMAEVIGITVYILAPQLVAFFDSNPEVIAVGVTRCRRTALFFCLLSFSHSAAGILRGAGKAVIPMLVMMAVWCVFRVAYITVAVRIAPRIETVYSAYPLTWSISTVIFLIYLKWGKWLPLQL